MNKINVETCYMCERTSCSREHVPPRCLFPEPKDTGMDLRKQLITVPSCELHNSRKSADDEFLLVSLAGIIGNNSIGYTHKFTKVNRAIRRSAFRLLDEAMKDKRIELAEVAPNRLIDITWGIPDHKRLEDCFDRIARGLHFHRFGRKFLGATRVLLGYTRNESSNPTEFKRFVKDKVESELVGKPRLGSNPMVFTYQFTDPDIYGFFLVYMQFYGGLDVYVSLIPQGAVPPGNIATQLIDMGIHTVFSFDGKAYEFNAKTPIRRDSQQGNSGDAS
jgi:hypothetical protein